MIAAALCSLAAEVAAAVAAPVEASAELAEAGSLVPAEEMTAERILASIYPVANPVAHREAIQLLINALTEAFRMDWVALRKICYLPDYRVGEELSQFRTEAKQRADTLGLTTDPVDGKATGKLPDWTI